MPPPTLNVILTRHRSQPNQLIEALQDIQESQGYISREAMESTSLELGVPVMEVYRTASFYKAFRLKPAGKHVLTMCMGTACHVRGAHVLLDQATSQIGVKPGEVSADGLFSVEHVNCLGACALGPIVVENGVYYDHMTPGKLRKLIEKISRQEAEDSKDAPTK